MLIKLGKKLVDTLLPPQCVLTGNIVTESRGLSSEAFARIRFISEPYCDSCAAPLDYANAACNYCASESYAFQRARSVFEYDDVSKALILQYKYSDRLSLTPVFVNWLIHYGKDILTEADFLVPVPLHPSRLRKRMYNQAAELTKGISRQTGIQCLLNALIRTRATLPQGHEDTHDRHINMRGAFEVNSAFEEHIKGKSIVLIDDVMTSGATLNECAKTLLPHTPKKISILTLSKALLS